MELGLAGRVCVVTGASKGIGRETARMLCAEGARVLLVARTERDVVEAADECLEAGDGGGRRGRVPRLRRDRRPTRPIASSPRPRSASAPPTCSSTTPAPPSWRDLDDVPDEDWYAAWELNVMAPMRLMKAATPGMRERGWGRVVNVSSTAGKRPSASMAEYSVAKAAQLSLSRLYADRCAGDGVLVNAVCPGPTKSEMWMDEGGLLDQSKEAGGHDCREEALDAAGAKRPIGRLAEVEEIAGAIVFLCSEQASYVAGAAWSVDGGTVQVII